MLRIMRLGLPFWSALLLATLSACTPSQPARVSTVPPPERPAPRELAPKDRLALALEAVEAPSDPLVGLAPALRQALGTVVARLSPAERLELTGPRGASHALFHLAAGGTDPEALYRLATGSAPVQLLSLRTLDSGIELATLAPAVSALVENAGRAWLRGVAFQIRSSTASLVLCDRIQRVAEALALSSVSLLSQDLALSLSPTPERRIQYAIARAQALEPQAARRILASLAVSGATAATVTAPDAPSLVVAEQLVQLAERLPSSVSPLPLPLAVQRGRGLLALDRVDLLPALLKPLSAQVDQHLGIAVLSSWSDLGGSTCPGIPRRSQIPILCAQAWSNREKATPIQGRLEHAWATGAGRDVEAIEAYLGLAHVVPLATATQLEPDRTVDQVQRVGRLIAALQNAERDYPGFAGLRVFASALEQGLLAATTRRKFGQRAEISAANLQELLEAGQKLAQGPSRQRFSTAGILGVLGVTFLDSDGEPLLRLLPSELAPAEARARAWFRVWNGLAQGRPESVTLGRSELLGQSTAAPSRLHTETATSLPSEKEGDDAAPSDPGAISHLVLTLAEADYANTGSPAALEQLSQIAERLRTARVGPNLAWRAGLDRAGVLARRGEPLRAATILKEIVDQAPSDPNATGFDWAWIARVYQAVLAVRGGTMKRVDGARELAQILSQVPPGGLSATVILWAEEWMRQLSQAAACRASATCGPAAQRIGAQSARVLQRGAVPLGAVSLHFNYSARTGVVPLVDVEPSFIAVEVPPTLIAGTAVPVTIPPRTYDALERSGRR